MKKLFSIFCLIALLILSGCSSDDPFVTPDGVDGDGVTMLNILIPSASMARSVGQTRGAGLTRGECSGTADVLTNESAIHQLHIFCFYNDATEGNQRKYFHADLTGITPEEVDEMYFSYNLNVAPGTYKIYVIANVNFGSGTLEALAADAKDNITETEDYISKISLPHAYNGDAGLPMSCQFSAEVKAAERTQVTAPMAFACAKVRLTVLFDSEEGGVSAGVFGQGAELNFNSLKVENAYPQSPIFSDGTEPTMIASAENGSKAVNLPTEGNFWAYTHGYYEYPNFSSLADLLTVGQIGGTSPLDAISGNYDNVNKSKFAWQSVSYLPECVGVNDLANKTKLILSGNAGGQDVSYTFTPGCSGKGEGNESAEHLAGGDLKRGHFYDIVARISQGGEIELRWKISDWTTESDMIALSGMSNLRVGRDEIEYLSGEKPQMVAYETSAPKLTLTSEAINGVDVFLLSNNTSEKVIEVQLNPALVIDVDSPLNKATAAEKAEGKVILENLRFVVQAGYLSKEIIVKRIDLSQYVTISPDDRTVYMSQISDRNRYDEMVYNYGTNYPILEIALTSVSNGNAQKTSEEDLTAANNARVYFELCDYDATTETYVPFTKKMLLENSATINTAENRLEGMEERKGGYVRITIEDPTNNAYFGKEISGTFVVKGKKSESDENPATDKATFKLIPIATTYTIHFKANTGNWPTPHIYVYQPLEYKGYRIFGNSSSMNWVQYSFTGRLAFQGWKNEGGTVEPPTSDGAGKLVPVTDAGGGRWTGYHRWEDLQKEQHDVYEKQCEQGRYYHVDLLPSEYYTKAKENCTVCNNGFPNVWPGIAMTKEEGKDNWYKIELPLFAKPNEALVMFTGGHGDGFSRYPAHAVPGIPLPNYASCEAWFLYDTSNNHAESMCSFSDYEREDYAEGNHVDTDRHLIGFRWLIGAAGTSERVNIYGNNGSGGPGNTLNRDSWSWSAQDPKSVDLKYRYTIINTSYHSMSEVFGFSFEQGVNYPWSGSNHSGPIKKEDDPALLANYPDVDELYTIWGSDATEPQPEVTDPDENTLYDVIFRWPVSLKRDGESNAVDYLRLHFYMLSGHLGLTSTDDITPGWTNEGSDRDQALDDGKYHYWHGKAKKKYLDALNKVSTDNTVYAKFTLHNGSDVYINDDEFKSDCAKPITVSGYPYAFALYGDVDSSGGGETEPSGDEYYVVRWAMENFPGASNGSNTRNQVNYLYVRKNGSDTNLLFGSWDNCSAKCDYSGYYYTWVKKSDDNPALTLGNTYQYKLHKSNNSPESNEYYDFNTPQVTTINESVIPSGVKSQIGTNIKIVGAFEIKYSNGWKNG